MGYRRVSSTRINFSVIRQRVLFSTRNEIVQNLGRINLDFFFKSSGKNKVLEMSNN